MEIDAKEVYEYARDIERALRRLPKRVLGGILNARAAEEVAAAIEALPHLHSTGPAINRRELTRCTRCLLLGGWPQRNAVWPRMIPPVGNQPARTVPAKIENRTLPELLFLAVTEIGAMAGDLDRVADSVAAPTLYDDVCIPEIIEPENRALTKTHKARSLAQSRRICAEERVRRSRKRKRQGDLDAG